MYAYPTQGDPMTMIAQQMSNLKNGYEQQMQQLQRLQQQYTNNYQQQSTYNQPQQQAQQPAQQPQPNAIPCIPVASIDEVKAHRVDPMGGASVFYASGLNTFFTKHIDNAGLAQINAYGLVPPTETREPSFVERSELAQVINDMQTEIKQLREAVSNAAATTNAQYIASDPAIDADPEPNAVYPTTGGIDAPIPKNARDVKRQKPARSRNDSAKPSPIDGY